LALTKFKNRSALAVRAKCNERATLVSIALSQSRFSLPIPAPEADGPRQWSPGQFTARGPNRNFDVHPDGKRIMVMKTPDAETPSISKVSFIFNFSEELRRKVRGQS